MPGHRHEIGDGPAVAFGAAIPLMAQSERMMRQRLAAIPDGEYTSEGGLDDDGRNLGTRLKVK